MTKEEEIYKKELENALLYIEGRIDESRQNISYFLKMIENFKRQIEIETEALDLSLERLAINKGILEDFENES